MYIYLQGDKLVSKSTFSEGANNNEMARHLYYLGRIKATQLEYSSAHQHLLQVCQNYLMHVFSTILHIFFLHLSPPSYHALSSFSQSLFPLFFVVASL